MLLIGLGNPGSKYEFTRHNAGFLIIDKLSRSMNLATFANKYNSLISDLSIDGKKIFFAKPQTYMNLSGEPAIQIKNFYKIQNDDIIIIHDDIDLKFGDIRMKRGGGSGGHNGLKSLDAYLGKDYWRLRIGIGRPDHPDFEISNYVLGSFNNQELKGIDLVSQKIIENFQLLIDKKMDRFIEKVRL